MAWFPDAERNEIAPGANDPAIEVVGALLHVAVSEGASLRPIFANRNGIESHFYVRRNGSVEQYRNTGREADANYKANSFYQGGKRKGYISIETQGMGHGEWTDAQIESIKRILSWASEVHGFRLRRATSPFGGGVGYHSQFLGAWSPVAKSCPGPDRIRQFHTVITPWMRSGGKGMDELSWNEEIAKWSPIDNKKGDHMTTGKSLNQARGYAEAAYEMAKSAENKATKAARRARRIEDALKAIAEGISEDVHAAVEDALSDEYDVTLKRKGE